jgi:hypothetical protein
MDDFVICDNNNQKTFLKKNLKEFKGNTGIKFVDKSYLKSFKEYMKKEIDNFSPNKNTSDIHILIKGLWHHYIFNNVDDDKYYEYVKILNNNIENK